MKWRVFFTILTVIMIACFLSPIPTVKASDLDKINIKEDEIINSDVFITNKDLLNKGEIIGDIFFTGNVLENKGFISGDILGLFPELSITGRTKGNIRGIARKVSIDGEVNRSLTLMTKQLLLEKQSNVDGSITIVGDEVVIGGNIGSDIRGVAKNLIIDGTVKGDVNIRCEKIVLKENALIMGNLTYHSSEEIKIPSHKVKGEIIQSELKTSKLKDLAIKAIKRLKIIVHISLIASMLLLSTLFIKLAPNEYIRLHEIFKKKPKNCLKLGSCITFLLPIVILILALTIVFIPVSIVIGFIYFMLIYISAIPVAMIIGESILIDKVNPIIKVLIVLIILTVLGYIPYLGMIINLIIFIIGTGIILAYIKEITKRLNQNNIDDQVE